MAWEALRDASKEGDICKVKQIVEQIINGDETKIKSIVNHRYTGGWTLLHVAAFKSSTNVVRYLVNNGADVNSKEDVGRTPLHKAADAGSLEIAQFLLQNGGQVNAKDNDGETPLYWACYEGHETVAEYLLENGAVDVINDTVRGFHTPLTSACYEGYAPVVRTLIKYGVDIRKPDAMKNKTPFDWSVEYGNDEVADLLKEELRTKRAKTYDKHQMNSKDVLRTPMRSKVHQEKLQKLSKIWDDYKSGTTKKITKVGPAVVCFEDEFVIGDGCDGTCVYVGFLEDGSEVAVKRMISYTCKALAENEKSILNHLREAKSPHIVNYRHFAPSEPFSYLVLDLCEENLEVYVESCGKDFLQEHGPVMVSELLSGLKALHFQQILHMDLKPSNILVDTHGHLRLADFGTSRILAKDQSTVKTREKGTRGWMAVECIPGDGSNKIKFKRKSDIQVMGMVIFYVLTKGLHPFGGVYDRVRNILLGNPVNLYRLADTEAKDLVAWMLNHSSKDRPYVQEALRHSYLKHR